MTTAVFVDWPAVEQACEAWVKRALPTHMVYWLDRASADKRLPYVELSIFGESQAGDSDLAWDDNGEPDITSLQLFTLGVRARARGQQSDKTARNALMRLKTTLQHPGYYGPLNAAGVAFLEVVGDVRKLSAPPESDRNETNAQLDLRFNCVFRFYEPGAIDPVGFAETADFTVNGATTVAPPES